MKNLVIYYNADDPNPVGLGYDTYVTYSNGQKERIVNIIHYFNNED